MKVGIIIHSHTGNTLAVSQRLKEKLVALGHSVNVEQVTAANEKSSAGDRIQLKTIPDINAYDVLIFGAPVQALSLSPVMKAYLSGLTSLSGKKVGCFVTQQFAYAWLGGNRSINQMKRICKSKGQNVSETGVVNWSHKERERKITDVIDKLSKLL